MGKTDCKPLPKRFTPEGEPVEQFLPLWQAKHRDVEAKGWDKLQNRIVQV